MFTAFTFTAVLWNVITVSLRQTIIPDHLLGRVNSVYRFFAWGMMPIGLAIGGLIVSTTESAGSRELALRMPWFFAAAAFGVLFIYAAPRLTTAKLEAARAEGIAAKKAEKAAAKGAESTPDEAPTEVETASEAIAETGIAGAPPPIDEDDDS